MQYNYDQDTDSIVVTTDAYSDGGRTVDESVELVPVTEASVEMLRDAIQFVDPIMFNELQDDDDASELAICFRSCFMSVNDALTIHNFAIAEVQP